MHRPLIETASCCSITGTDWSHNTTLLKLHSSLSFLIRNRAAFDPSFFFLCTGLTSASPPPYFGPPCSTWCTGLLKYSLLTIPSYYLRIQWDIQCQGAPCYAAAVVVCMWDEKTENPPFIWLIFFITQSSVYAHLGSIAPVDPSLSLSPFHTSYISHIEEAGEHGSDSNTGL